MNSSQFDTEVEKSDYFSICLSESLVRFLKKQFAIYSYDKYFLSSADLAKIFEPVNSKLSSVRP